MSTETRDISLFTDEKTGENIDLFGNPIEKTQGDNITNETQKTVNHILSSKQGELPLDDMLTNQSAIN